MADLTKIEGIGEAYAGKLKEAGIASIQALLEQGSAPKGRKSIAASTGINETLILRWVNHCDLFRVKGIGEQYADLLEAAGVDTVPDLARRDPAVLYQKIGALNAEKRLVRQLPSEGQVRAWVATAKELPRLVSY